MYHHVNRCSRDREVASAWKHLKVASTYSLNVDSDAAWVTAKQKTINPTCYKLGPLKIEKEPMCDVCERRHPCLQNPLLVLKLKIHKLPGKLSPFHWANRALVNWPGDSDEASEELPDSV